MDERADEGAKVAGVAEAAGAAGAAGAEKAEGVDGAGGEGGAEGSEGAEQAEGAEGSKEGEGEPHPDADVDSPGDGGGIGAAIAGYKQNLKRILDGDFDNASQEERERASTELIQSCAIAAGLIALQPLPFIDPLLITPIHIGMVRGIAHVYGYSLDKKSVLEILRTLRRSLFVEYAAMAAAKFAPLYGQLASATIAHTLTVATGELTVRYFRRGRSMLPPQMRATFRRIYREHFRSSYERYRDRVKSKFRRAGKSERRQEPEAPGPGPSPEHGTPQAEE